MQKNPHRLFLCYEVMQILKDKVVKIGCGRYSYKSAGIRPCLMFTVPLPIPEKGSTKASFIFKSKRQSGDLSVSMYRNAGKLYVLQRKKKQQMSTSVAETD